MADQWNDGIPALGHQIISDIPDIEETLALFQSMLKMCIGWKDDTIASVGPPPHRALFTYSDTDTLTIGPGSYFHDGTTRQIVFWDANITFDLGSGGSNAGSTDLGASEWHYIYLDDSAIVTQDDTELDADCFLNSTTGPSWSATKHGWYNGADRCIFAVLTNGSSQIIEFLHNGSNYVQFARYVDGLVLNAQNIGTSGSPTTATMIAPAFCSFVQAHFQYIYVDAEASLEAKNYSQAAGNGQISGYVSSGTTVSSCTLIISCDSSQRLKVWEGATSTNTLTLNTDGWFLPDTI